MMQYVKYVMLASALIRFCFAMALSLMLCYLLKFSNLARQISGNAVEFNALIWQAFIASGSGF